MKLLQCHGLRLPVGSARQLYAGEKSVDLLQIRSARE
uniref:FERM domain-containing protein n=1 Tax=Ascaris lumbricoides TaxID=6252 RepID=A0A0M3IK87_ASCLU